MSYALCNLLPFIHITSCCVKNIYQVLVKNVLNALLDFPIEEWEDSQGNTMEPQKPGK